MISVATRFRPFSHRFGSQCILPGTDVVVEAFPHALRIGALEIPLQNDPLVRDFTLQQDLEKNCVWVFGKEFRIKITARHDGFEVITSKEKKFFPANILFHLPTETERLSLGSHKAQDWDLVLRRLDLKEILPPLYLLSQKTPTPSFSQETQLNESLENFYRTSFHQLIVPRINGENVFREAFMKIRSLFVIDRGNHIQLLPNNPFLEGRMLNIQTENAAIDIEWTKGRLRRVTLYVRKTGDVFLELPKEILSFRVKMQLHERGTLQKRGDPLHCVAGARMYLDRFIRPLA